MASRWIVFLDVDGTLFGSRLTCSERTRQTLRAAEATADIVLASGRPAASCLRIARELLDSPRIVIASNGGAVVDCQTHDVLGAAHFETGSAAAVVALARSAGLAVCVYHPLQWFASEDDARTLQEVSRSGSLPTLVVAVEDYLDLAVKLLLIGNPLDVQRLRPVVEDLGAITAFETYPEYLEVMPASCDKAAAAQIARNVLAGDDGCRTMAVGDGFGDLSLFKFVDEAVAVANAPSVVQQSAGYIAPSNDDDGAAVAIE